METVMGTVHIDITLKNPDDESLVRNGYKKPEDIRTAAVTATVDKGAFFMAITEELAINLGLEATGERIATMSDGQLVKCKLIDVVNVQWKDRKMIMQALIIPGSEKILIGPLGLGALDLMVDPVRQQVVGAHGDKMEILVL